MEKKMGNFNAENSVNELSENMLEKVTGGAGGQSFAYSIGDLLALSGAFDNIYFYFGKLADIEVYYDGETRYIIQTNCTAYNTGYCYRVSEYHADLQLRPEELGQIIKKLSRFPEPGDYGGNEFSEFI